MKTNRIIIGIVGLPASGKGTIAAYIEERYGAIKLRFSDSLKDVLLSLEIEATRDKLITLSEVLRRNYGEDVLATAIRLRAEQSSNPIVVIDGVRREADIEIFKSLHGFVLIAVTAEATTRYERSTLRAEKPEEASQTFEEFMAHEQRSTERSARALMAYADVTIDNNASIENLHRHIDDFITKQHLHAHT